MKRIWIPEAPYIHRRRLIEGELIAPTARIQGIMHVELVHARTGLIARQLTFPNLIVDAGLDAIGTTMIATLTNYCAVGTGNSAPAVNQTALDVEVVRTNATGGFAEERGIDGALAYTWWKRTRVFTTAQANATLAEIGFFQSSSAGTMFARQLIKDELGNPTTITKTSEYELRVTYEVRWYIPAQTEYSALVNGVSETIRTRAASATNGTSQSGHGWRPDGDGTFNTAGFEISTLCTGSLGAVTSVPSGALANSSSMITDAYVPGSYERTSLARWDAAVANDTVVKSIVTPRQLVSVSRAGYMVFQHELLAGGISKNNAQRFDFYVQHSWARYP